MPLPEQSAELTSEITPEYIQVFPSVVSPAILESASLADLVERVPEGWTRVAYRGRHYGLSRTTRVAGRSISVSAVELGGRDLISANVYRTLDADLLRACEMPDEKVLAFLRGWTPA